MMCLPWTFLVVFQQLVNEWSWKILELTSEHAFVHFVVGHMYVILVAIIIKLLPSLIH